MKRSIFLLVLVTSFFSNRALSSIQVNTNQKFKDIIDTSSLEFIETPEKLKEVVAKISEINEVQTEYINGVRTISENYRNFTQLKKVAKNIDLVDLTRNKNATVACYAGWALADKSYSKLKSIFIYFLSNDREVMTMSSIIYPSLLSNELYFRYRRSIKLNKLPQDKILLQLDSTILYLQNPDEQIIKSALSNRKFKEQYRSQIEYLAFNKDVIYAIFYLNRWHKLEYADQIKTSLLKYLNNTNFERIRTDIYFETVCDLLEYNDPLIKEQVIEKLKFDRRWEFDLERFKKILVEYSIYEQVK
jgi:hypothetical protein